MKKRKRQQKAQSRLANARHQQQECEARTARLAERAEKRWQQTQRLLTQPGATFQQTEEEKKGASRSRTKLDPPCKGCHKCHIAP